MISHSLHSLLGLCQRAGQVASGELAAEQALKKRRVQILFVANDASARTAKRFTELADRVGVPCYRVGTRDELGGALGKAHRAAVAVLSRDFTVGMMKILESEGFEPVKGRG